MKKAFCKKKIGSCLNNVFTELRSDQVGEGQTQRTGGGQTKEEQAGASQTDVQHYGWSGHCLEFPHRKLVPEMYAETVLRQDIMTTSNKVPAITTTMHPPQDNNISTYNMIMTMASASGSNPVSSWFNCHTTKHVYAIFGGRLMGCVRHLA
jgi:hypothetical protein